MNKLFKVIQLILLTTLFVLSYFFYVWYIQPFPNLDIVYHVNKSVLFKNYDINKYNCQNFSMDMREELKYYNVLFVGGYLIDSNYYIVKFSNENINQLKSIPALGKKKAHEWIYIVDYNLYIEATNGTVIPNSQIKYLD